MTARSILEFAVQAAECFGVIPQGDNDSLMTESESGRVTGSLGELGVARPMIVCSQADDILTKRTQYPCHQRRICTTGKQASNFTGAAVNRPQVFGSNFYKPLFRHLRSDGLWFEKIAPVEVHRGIHAGALKSCNRSRQDPFDIAVKGLDSDPPASGIKIQGGFREAAIRGGHQISQPRADTIAAPPGIPLIEYGPRTAEIRDRQGLRARIDNDRELSAQ